MPLVFTLAFRNLFHDRLRFIATVIGIVFSIVLVTVQMGLYLGFGQMVTTMIDHAVGRSLDHAEGNQVLRGPLAAGHAAAQPRAVRSPGTAEAIPVVIGFADWRTPSGSSTPVFVVGSDLRAGGLEPWNLVEGRARVAVHAQRGRGRPHLFRPAWHLRAGRARRNPPAAACGSRRSPTASVPSPRRPMCSWMSTARGRTPACRRARPPISWCASSTGADVQAVRARSAARASPMSRC